jgi:pimeloyl-ACP methyl ester carboxylesterase
MSCNGLFLSPPELGALNRSLLSIPRLLSMNHQTVKTDTLEIAYEAHGPSDGPVVILLHGFPYDPRCYDDVAPALSSAGCRVLVPYLRGYGLTRFLSSATVRSGEQAALGIDLLRFMDALNIRQAGLVGFDWGGRAACVVSALWPQRVRFLISSIGYNIQNIAASTIPGDAAQEHRRWYHFYFHTERGRAGLTQNRYELCKLLWRLWSPEWKFDETTFARSARSFDNPDFVDVVIQSYRHRYGYAPGDPELFSIESALSVQPKISVPTLNLHGQADGVTSPPVDDPNPKMFTGSYERWLLESVGHNPPQEAPTRTVDAILYMRERTRDQVTGRHNQKT